MASIRKSFSFRNGVQVDEDNFIVNANGLVGIGTSVPSEFLDVRGTAKVVGLTTTNDLFVSGFKIISDSLIAFQPAIDEPSKKTPLVNKSSSTVEIS